MNRVHTQNVIVKFIKKKAGREMREVNVSFSDSQPSCSTISQTVSINQCVIVPNLYNNGGVPGILLLLLLC